MTMVIDLTTLCICLHINASHPDSEACSLPGCTCRRFAAGSRSSAHHYRRGQRLATKRVAHVEAGDIVLAGYPGHDEYVRDVKGDIIWDRRTGELTSHPRMHHIADHTLRPVASRTGALLAYVTGRHTVEAVEKPGGRQRAPGLMHVIETDLGELPPMYGTNSVLVVIKERS